MTGQGHASAEGDLGTIRVEVRTVNHRGLKCHLRLGDALLSFESKIDALIRSLIARGSLSLSVSWRKPSGQEIPPINVEVLSAYANKLAEVQGTIRQETGADGVALSIDLAALVSLPGVMSSTREPRREDDQLWNFVRDAVTDAMANLDQMRHVEGGNMATSLRADATLIAQELVQIRKQAPQAADHYRNRLESKIQRLLSEQGIESQAIDLLREVQIYADRVDISEEITRLESHLQMFDSVLAGDPTEGTRREPTGRKLDFVIQEMFRETNTIGSKASDAAIATHVVEIKCAIERMRELVQNLE